MQKRDGMNYAPTSKVKLNYNVGEFKFAVAGLDHGHIYGMCNGLIEAGAQLVKVYDRDGNKVKAFLEKFPGVLVAQNEEEILDDPEISLVAAAHIPYERCDFGIRVLKSGKDYFVDKPGMTTMEQLERAQEAVEETGRKYYIYFSERLHVEGAVFAEQLIKNNAIGRVLQVTILAPHRINIKSRPEWFFDRKKYGGILVDIGSHQIEQFLAFSGAKTAQVLHSKTGNYVHKDYGNFEDFGDANLLGDNGATCYFRVDWFTPDGLCAWGDGRTFIMGTDGYIEIRKYLDLALSEQGDNVYLANKDGEFKYNVNSEVGYPFFGEFIMDCINRTENSMTQSHVFEAMRICIEAQSKAMSVE